MDAKATHRYASLSFFKFKLISSTKLYGAYHSELGLSWCVVLPEQQRRGIGQALMSWGLSRTDKAGLESYVEATPAGRKLYERCGYHFVARVNIVVKNTDGDETWKDLESRVLPSGYDSIWRPILGVCEKGEPQRTWKDRLRSA